MTRDEIEQRMEDARSIIKMMTVLEESPEWTYFHSHGAAAIRILRTSFVGTPILSMDAAVKAAHEQGQLAGWQTALSYPRILREEAEQGLVVLRDELNTHIEFEEAEQEQLDG